MTCAACHRDLPAFKFHLDYMSPTGRKLTCRDCRNAARRERYATNADYRARRLAENNRSRGLAP